MDEMTLTLNSPITEEQWDAITDVDFEHTNEITFHTKHDKTVKFVKASAQPEQTDCEYCHEDSDGYARPIEKNSHVWLARQGRTMKLRACFKGGYSECDISYCPMCGRRLNHG